MKIDKNPGDPSPAGPPPGQDATPPPQLPDPGRSLLSPMFPYWSNPILMAWLAETGRPGRLWQHAMRASKETGSWASHELAAFLCEHAALAYGAGEPGGWRLFAADQRAKGAILKALEGQQATHCEVFEDVETIWSKFGLLVLFASLLATILGVAWWTGGALLPATPGVGPPPYSWSLWWLLPAALSLGFCPTAHVAGLLLGGIWWLVGRLFQVVGWDFAGFERVAIWVPSLALLGLMLYLMAARLDHRAYAFVKDGRAILVFRGTDPGRGELTLIDGVLLPCGRPLRHLGFVHTWLRLRPRILAWVESVRADVSGLSLTGHSLGGALSFLAAWELSDWIAVEAVITFGAPRPGLSRFKHLYETKARGPRLSETLGAVTRRYAHGTDLIARIPPEIPYRHVGEGFPLPLSGKLGDPSRPDPPVDGRDLATRWKDWLVPRADYRSWLDPGGLSLLGPNAMVPYSETMPMTVVWVHPAEPPAAGAKSVGLPRPPATLMAVPVSPRLTPIGKPLTTGVKLEEEVKGVIRCARAFISKVTYEWVYLQALHAVPVAVLAGAIYLLLGVPYLLLASVLKRDVAEHHIRRKYGEAFRKHFP